MHFSKGDKVRLLYTAQTGIVLYQHDDEVVMVHVDGKNEAVFVQHLEKITPSAPSKKLSADTFIPQKIEPITDGLPDQGIKVYFQAVYTKDNMIEYFLILLHNDSGQKLKVDYQFFLGVEKIFQIKKTLSGREHILLNTLQFTELNDYPELEFHFELAEYNDYQAFKFEKILKPKAKMLRKAAVEINVLQSKAYIYPLFNKLPKNKGNTQQMPSATKSGVQKIVIEKEQSFEKKSKTSIHAEQRIVDLHIERLLDSHQHLPKNKILQTQLKHFEEQLSLAIQQKEASVIVIHGLGKGKLKQEIIKCLRFYPEVQTFENEYDARFGFGATKIMLEYE